MLNRTNKTYFVNKQHKKKKYYKITVTIEEYSHYNINNGVIQQLLLRTGSNFLT
jgi:hypothetical protein